MQTLLFVVFFSTQASAYNPLDPYNQQSLPVQCSVNGSLYPCMHNGKLVRSIVEDPTKSLLKDDRSKAPSGLFSKCPDGSMPRQQFIASKKIGGPMELRYGCPEVIAKPPPPQRVEQTYHPPPKPAQKPRALKPEQKVVVKEVPREVNRLVTPFNVFIVLFGFLLGRISLQLTLKK